MVNHWAGPDLAALRRAKGISLGNIAQNTKIGVRYLEAIELGQFGKLPGGLYDVSYIRQYAQALEYDEAELLEYYRGVAEPDPPTAVSPAPPHSPPRWFDIAILRNVSMRKLPKI